MLILVEIGVFILVVDLLNLLFTSFHILAHDYLLFISIWSIMRFHSFFVSLGRMVQYNCLTTCLYTL
jgi:hypothetical protein